MGGGAWVEEFGGWMRRERTGRILNQSIRQERRIVSNRPHTYIPTYIHTYIPTYLHTHIHTYKQARTNNRTTNLVVHFLRAVLQLLARGPPGAPVPARQQLGVPAPFLACEVEVEVGETEQPMRKTRGRTGDACSNRHKDAETY